MLVLSLHLLPTIGGVASGGGRVVDLSLDVGAGAGGLTRMLRDHPALATPPVSVWAWVLLFMG